MRKLVLAAPLLLAACGVLPVMVIDTARAPVGAFASGAADPDTSAVYFAQWAFADPARTRGRPFDAARAVAAMDYIAGQLNTGPRWALIPAVTQLQLLQAREEVRQAVGVVPNAPSQAVVDRFAAAANALYYQDEPAAFHLLSGPIFTAPPQAIVARLNDLPYLQTANVATMRAANSLFRTDRSSWR